MRFAGVDVNPVVGGKGCWIEPRAVGEERIASEEGDRGLEMQAAGHRDGDDFVIVPFEDGGELADAIGIAALRDTDKEFAADAKNIAAFEGTWKRDVLKFAKLGKGWCERRGFRTARGGAQRKDHGEFVQDDSGILDEHGIGKIRLSGKGNDAGAEAFEKLFVDVMLLARDLEVDRLACNEG